MIHSYKNGNYTVLFFDNDGTKVRRTEEDEFIPQFAENCDVKITDKCSQGCPFCYEGCISSGKHADLFKYYFIETLHPYTELALNGNDLDHPQLETFLKFLKEKKVFANITVNQCQFMGNLDKLHKWTAEGLIHGLGVSLNDSSDSEFIKELVKFPNAVLHVIAGIFNADDRLNLKGKGIKLLILGYKDIRRGSSYKSAYNSKIKLRIKSLKSSLSELLYQDWFKVVSFDNLAIEQLEVREVVSKEDWQEFYMGDDGDYTFYIDMVSGTYAKNSISQDRYSIREDQSVDEMFEDIRKKSRDEKVLRTERRPSFI